MTGIVFVQKGYWIDIISTHDTDAYIRHSDSSQYGLLIKVASCNNDCVQDACLLLYIILTFTWKNLLDFLILMCSKDHKEFA